MRRTFRLAADELESRENPVAFGTPWPNGRHLTLSFAPDATALAGGSSNLSVLGTEAQQQVLTAFQAWAVGVGVNIGLVPDDGSPFGTGGAVQGDPRFGDIRVGGTALPGDVLAITSPYTLYDNYSGNVVVNTAAFGPGGPDLYTVMLQEAGHALGVGNSTDPGSVMYEYYAGPRSGLGPGDVASLQALYGARPADQSEGTAGNGTFTTATPYAGPLTADVTATDDVDIYRFTGKLFASRATVTLRASGLSLLAPKVELLNAAGNVLATGAATDPTNNDVTVATNSVHFGAAYFVRVTSARADDFGIGSYQLDVQQRTLLGDLLGTIGGLLDDTGLNDTIAAATGLLTGATAIDATTDFGVDGNFGSASDTDTYRVAVPASTGGNPVNLVATAWGENGAVLSPWVAVCDAAGTKLNAEVLTANGNTTILQFRELTPGGVYYVSLISDLHTVGNYHLAVDLAAEAAALPHGGGGSLAAAAAPAAAIFDLPQTAQVQFVLAATGCGANLVVKTEAGTVAAVLTAPAGRGRSVVVLLPAGQYRIEIRSSDPSSAFDFRLGLAVITDPTGATPTDPTNDPEQPPPPPPEGPPPQPPPAPPPTPPLQPADPEADDSWWY